MLLENMSFSDNSFLWYKMTFYSWLHNTERKQVNQALSERLSPIKLNSSIILSILCRWDAAYSIFFCSVKTSVLDLLRHA